MNNFYFLRWLLILSIILLGLLIKTESKGFGFGRSSGYKGGSSGGSGLIGKLTGRNRGNHYGTSYGNHYGGGYGGTISKPRGGSSFRKNAMRFGMGAAGGVMAYSLMKSLGRSHGYRHGHYNSGYGYGNTCVNNENMDGIVFGSFRCPLNGFPIEAQYCCGEYGRQFCCTKSEYYSSSYNYK